MTSWRFLPSTETYMAELKRKSSGYLGCFKQEIDGAIEGSSHWQEVFFFERQKRKCTPTWINTNQSSNIQGNRKSRKCTGRMVVLRWRILLSYEWGHRWALFDLETNDFGWFLIVYRSLWWFMMICAGSWWFMMVYDDLWQSMVAWCSCASHLCTILTVRQGLRFEILIHRSLAILTFRSTQELCL